MKKKKTITLTIEVDPLMAQYIAALLHLWSMDMDRSYTMMEDELQPLDGFVWDLANKLWGDMGLFSAESGHGVVSQCFSDMASECSTRHLWAFRNVVAKTPHWLKVEDRLDEMATPAFTLDEWQKLKND